MRCQVVVDLILDMKRLGHPAFASMDPEVVRANAAALPENGIPQEVLQVIEDELLDAEDKLQPQKAATPTDARHEDASSAGRGA